MKKKTKRRKKSKKFNFGGLKKKVSAVFRHVEKKFGKHVRFRHRPRFKLPRNERWMAFAWFLPTVLLFVAVGIMLKPKARYPLPLISARVVGMFQSIQDKPLSERATYWSDRLLANPELLKSLGGGPEIADTAPLFPPAYDCTTFVETVGALAMSRSTDEVADKLISIRYRDGVIGYETRNHFPEADWIPNNERSGNLRDITLQVARKAGFMAAFAYKDIDKLTWLKQQHSEQANRVIAKSSDTTEPVSVKLPYIPLEQAMAAFQHAPTGSVINVVRMSRDRYPVLVSHQGFLIWKNGVAYFRHASRDKKITEVPFASYIRGAKSMPWKVLGFNINAFNG